MPEPRWLSDVEVAERAICRLRCAKAADDYCPRWCGEHCVAHLLRPEATAVIVALRERHRMLVNDPSAPLIGFNPFVEAERAP